MSLPEGGSIVNCCCKVSQLHIKGHNIKCYLATFYKKYLDFTLKGRTFATLIVGERYIAMVKSLRSRCLPVAPLAIIGLVAQLVRATDS